MRKLIEIKQELNDGEENEDGSVESITTSLDHFNYQIAIKQEEISTSQAKGENVQLNEITSPTCQVKTEPQSEEVGCELESIAWDYPANYVIKREIIEVHVQDHPMMDDEENHKKRTRVEGSLKEANLITKSENDNWSPNFLDNNINKQINMFDETKEMSKQQIYGRSDEETEISHTEAKTLCQTKENYQCSVCTKVFNNLQACLQHMWNTHTEKSPYTCEDCGKGFKYLSQLQLHKPIHSDERPYSCDVCNKAFKQKRVLQGHKMSSHSNERPYSCDLCDRAFKRKSGLQSHKVICYSVEKPYSCDMCNKAFKHRRNLKMHKVLCNSIERPYSCDVCNKAFKHEKNLKMHKVLCHSVERPYSCDVCNKAFKQKSDLQTHKVLFHSVERPYTCDLCKKRFTQKGNLDGHKRTVHSDEKPHA